MKLFIINALCFVFSFNIFCQKYGLDLNVSTGYHFYDRNSYPKENQVPILFEVKFSEKNKNAGIGLMPMYSFQNIDSKPFPQIVTYAIPNSFASDIDKVFWHGLDAKAQKIDIAIPIFIGFRILNKRKFQLETRLSLIKNFEIWQHAKGLFQYYELDSTIMKHRFIRNENLEWQKFKIRNGFTLAYLGIESSFKMTDKTSLRLLLQYSDDFYAFISKDTDHQPSFIALLGVTYKLKEENNRLSKYRRHK